MLDQIRKVRDERQVRRHAEIEAKVEGDEGQEIEMGARDE
jgi:hypothetical protein